MKMREIREMSDSKIADALAEFLGWDLVVTVEYNFWVGDGGRPVGFDSVSWQPAKDHNCVHVVVDGFIGQPDRQRLYLAYLDDYAHVPGSHHWTDMGMVFASPRVKAEAAMYAATN